jgi:hypothetical protein
LLGLYFLVISKMGYKKLEAKEVDVQDKKEVIAVKWSDHGGLPIVLSVPVLSSPGW